MPDAASSKTAATSSGLTATPGDATQANLGQQLQRQGHHAEAVHQFRGVISVRPDDGAAWHALAHSLHLLGHVDEALDAYCKAAAYCPSSAAVYSDQGTLLFALGRNQEALTSFRRALELDPKHAPTHGNMAALLARAGHPVAAEAASRTAIALAGTEHRWWTNLGVALLTQARLAEAEAAYRSAIAMRPDYPAGHSNLLFALNYRPDIKPEEVFAEYQIWDRRHAAPLRPAQSNHTLDRSAGRRLRVGYVSPDFRQHAVAYFAEPLLAAHDHTQIDLYLYSDLAADDATTARFRALADHWRPTLGLTDPQLATLIERDQIDVLVDLAGHTAGNRLLAFARKPAPVQISYLLGHGYTTGLSAIDAFIADAVLTPPGSEALFSERLVRLPRIPLVYATPQDMPPVGPLPAGHGAGVTFGYFGRTERLNDAVIAAWTRIANALPRARIVLNNPPFGEAAFRRLFQQRFARAGLASEKLQLIATSPQQETWAAYADIDIALDPFPHNAGTTTIEALWQGVPVLSLAGRPSVGRFGACILNAVGLDDWVVTDIDAYVARATAAASDLQALAALRNELRARLQTSSLCDAAGLARIMEVEYRRLWDAWRQRDSPTLRRVFQSGDRDEARQLAHALLQHEPDNADAHQVLGILAYREQHLPDAESHFRAAVAVIPEDAEVHANHAAVLRALGRLREAEASARTAIARQPQCVGAYNNLGNILRDAGRHEESIACFRKAVQLTPGFADAWVNLSWVLALTGQAQQAEEAARRAIACAADNADAHNNLGLALMRQGRLAEAEAALRVALALRPDFAVPHSNILFCLNYRPDVSATEVFTEYQRWDRQHARPLMPARLHYDLDRAPSRRLRVGYVSPDFRQHAVALFAEPLLAAHDHAAVEVHCYAEVPCPDAVTARFRALADHWHNTVGLNDADLADHIRADRIDILVDLAGHTAGNRLLAFARKPSPIQITWLVGHGYSSGLSAMDAFLSDSALTPPGAESLFSEELIRLRRLPLAYAPPSEMPDVAPLPALRNGFVTFGYFGRTVRLNDMVIALWAAILQRQPQARLMLNSAPFSEAAGCEQMRARFAQHGIGPERLLLVHTTPQPRTWDKYGEVDIALDPFPHNAGTTTIEALWQGVPVISLAGRPTVGRFGAAILHAVGLDDWAVNDTDTYMQRALHAAANLGALAQLRASLRQRVAASPLGDAAGLAREVEAAYRNLWRRWCANQPADPRQLYAAGDLQGAATAAELCLRTQPDEPAALHVMGLLRFTQGDAAAAAVWLQRSAAAKPDPTVLSDLGVMLRATGQLAEAEATYRHALRLNPALAVPMGNLGNVLLDLRRPVEAVAVLRDAVARLPDRPWLLRSLALGLMASGADDEAEAALRQALSCNPVDPDVHDTLGALLAQSGRPIEAETHYRAALPHSTQRHRVLSNLSIALQTQARHAEAEQCCREALAINPDYAAAQANLLFSLNYRADLGAECIFAAYRDWDRRLSARSPPVAPPAVHSLSGRRLRIGYVSADFRQHSAAWFAEPLLAAHDRDRVELFCYAQIASPDAVTGRFRALADHWRSITDLEDGAAAARIRQDGLDVLVDMSGHTAGSRLAVFARKPAPVQVAYLLGHGYTSGLAAMDVFLADAVLAPPGADTLFSERIVRLPRIPLTYAPPEQMPTVGPLPGPAADAVTFGYFGRPERLNDAVIAAWARILREVPRARLVLNSRPFREAAFRDLFLARFGSRGIAPERLELIATAPQAATWRAYGMIDIALDPFPHNAGTTTIEALWLGVPVVSLADRPTVGRFGAMILHAIGLDDWVCDGVDAYVARAIAAISDLPTLAQLRADLRRRMATSPLCDAAGLAREFEDTFYSLVRAC